MTEQIEKWDGRKVFNANTGEYLGRALGEPFSNGKNEEGEIKLRQDESGMLARFSALCGLVVLDEPKESESN